MASAAARVATRVRGVVCRNGAALSGGPAHTLSEKRPHSIAWAAGTCRGTLTHPRWSSGLTAHLCERFAQKRQSSVGRPSGPTR